MANPTPERSLAGILALVATLFGGVFFGLGNMIALAADPDFAAVLHGDHGAEPGADSGPHPAGHAPSSGAGGGHEHHAGHDHPGPRTSTDGPGTDTMPSGPDTSTAHAVDGPLGIPAHCMFCLDGIVPTPAAFPVIPILGGAPTPTRIVAAVSIEVPVAVPSPAQPRAPPVRLA